MYRTLVSQVLEVSGDIMKENTLRKKVKVFFPKWVKGRGFVQNKINKSAILVNGLLLTCIGLSISSGFVDIVCYSGLSKSFFHLGTIPLAAATLYTIISIFLTMGKFWCGMKIGMLKELRTKLAGANKTWGKNIIKALLPWQIVHKFLIMISLLTAMSMSVNSIGAGIRTMQQNIDNMTADAGQLIELNNSVNSGVKDKREATKSNITGAITAKDDAKQEVERFYGLLVKYQDEYFALSDEDKNGEKGRAVISKIVNEVPGTSTRNALYFTKADLQKSIQSTATKNESVDNSKVYEEAVAYDKTQIEDTIRAIADKEYKTPDGDPIMFLNEDGSAINVQLAISRLQNGISLWQSDTGDVGESSKVFTLLATYMHANTKAGGMGAAEWMIMLFIFITGVIQEFLIALCTPAATIDRATLASVSHYCEWKDDEEKERFLIKVYKGYVGDGVFSQEDFEAKCKKCVELMEENEESIIKKYSKKNRSDVVKYPRRTITENKIEDAPAPLPTGYSDVIARKIKEVDSL